MTGWVCGFRDHNSARGGSAAPKEPQEPADGSAGHDASNQSPHKSHSSSLGIRFFDFGAVGK